MKTKQILAAAVVATLVTAFAVSCTKEKLEEGKVHPQSAGAATSTNQPAFRHTIPLDAVQSMVGNYEAVRLSKNPGDTKSGWFSLSELTSFIEDIKQSAKTNGTNVNDLGVRVYFTVYPEQHAGESVYFRSIENEYRNRLSFVMLPTYRDAATNSNTDVLEIGANSNSRVSQVFAAPNGATVALNHAALCPPNCPTKGGSGGL